MRKKSATVRDNRDRESVSDKRKIYFIRTASDVQKLYKAPPVPPLSASGSHTAIQNCIPDGGLWIIRRDPPGMVLDLIAKSEKNTACWLKKRS